MNKNKKESEKTFDCREICNHLSIGGRSAHVVELLFKEFNLTEEKWISILKEKKII